MEALHLYEELKTGTEKQWTSSKRFSFSESAVDGGDALKLRQTTTSNGRDCINTSDKWAEFYPNQQVTVVTSIGQPPIPPDGEKLSETQFKRKTD